MADQNKVLHVSVERCMGCKACEIACAVEHSFSKDLFTAIFEKPHPMPRVSVEAAAEYAVSIQCRHCERSPCVEACPTNALYRTAEGIVNLKEELCIGCKACIIACPFGAIRFDWDHRVIVKCDLCADRLSKGLQPACVEACPTKALKYGYLEDILKEIRKEAATAATKGLVVGPGQGIVVVKRLEKPGQVAGGEF